MALAGMASLRGSALLRVIAGMALLAFGFASGPRETLHSACPMHDGVALAQAAAADTPAAHAHHAPAGSDAAHGGQSSGEKGSHACDCMGDCAPGSPPVFAVPTSVAAAPASAPAVVRAVPRFHRAEVLAASADHFLPPATAPPSSV